MNVDVFNWCSLIQLADLKISPYIQIHIKIEPWKFCILNRKNYQVIYL